MQDAAIDSDVNKAHKVPALLDFHLWESKMSHSEKYVA